jgi:lysophospholipase L1-like esterase
LIEPSEARRDEAVKLGRKLRFQADLPGNHPVPANDILRTSRLFLCFAPIRRRRLGPGDNVNRARIGIAVLAIGALAAGLSYFRKEAVGDSHRRARQIILYYTLSRIDQPIIIIGDSLTEASTLPRAVCGHPIINAGLDGASTASDLGTWLTEALDGKRAAAILVALGTNDALLKHSVQTFESNYLALLAQLATVTDRLAVLGIPLIDVRGRVTAELRADVMGRIDAFNALLPALAGKGGAAFVALPTMGAPHTIDGVHLNAAGYTSWDEAVLKGVASACSPR